MKMKTILEKIWLINGVLFLGMMLLGIGLIVMEIWPSGQRAIEPGIIVGEKYDLSSTHQSQSFYKIYDRNAAAVNCLFKPKADNEEVHLLLNRRAFISHINYPRIPGESWRDFILYEIHFEDTNNDNLVNAADRGQFYISGIDGRGLTAVSPDSLQVYDYQIDPLRKEIFFFGKLLRPNIREEHIDDEVFCYSTTSGEWKPLTAVNNTLKDAAGLLN